MGVCVSFLVVRVREYHHIICLTTSKSLDILVPATPKKDTSVNYWPKGHFIYPRDGMNDDYFPEANGA